MMPKQPKGPFGDFTVFGFTQEPETFLQHVLPERLDIKPRTIDMGPAGHFFFYTSYGDVAEDGDCFVLVLGLVHSSTGDPLSAQALLARDLVNPRAIQADALRGNALVACFDKSAPEFLVYKTLLSMPQLYYSTHAQTLLCTDGPRPHLALLDQVQIDQEAMVQHFLFRYALGTHTYFEDIHRLLSGQRLHWRGSKIALKQVRSLRREPDAPTFERVDAHGLGMLYESMDTVVGAYIKDIKAAGGWFGNMLSGGVDSSLLQVLINGHVPTPERRKTLSYGMQAPGFEFEIEYAQEAGQMLQTDHTVVEMTPQDYPELLVRTIETLGYPIPAESQPCKLAIAEYLSTSDSDLRFFFVGTGGDTLHGTTLARKMALLESVRGLPLAAPVMRLAAAVLRPFARKKAHGLRQVAGMLSGLDDPYSYKIPINTVAMYTDIDMAHRSFGAEALKQAFRYRHEMEEQFLDSDDHIEKVHALELVTDAYETSVLVNQLYLTHGREQIYPFLDEGFIRISYAFAPGIRYLKGRQVKPLLKAILEQRGLDQIAHKPKGPSVFSEDLHDWMRSGVMRDMVEAIERPGFLSQADFKKLLTVPHWDPLDEPNWFLWNLLTFDIFKKRVIHAANQ